MTEFVQAGIIERITAGARRAHHALIIRAQFQPKASALQPGKYLVRLAGPGGLRSVVAESVLVKHQLRILNRGRKRAPTGSGLTPGMCSGFTISLREPRGASSIW